VPTPPAAGQMPGNRGIPVTWAKVSFCPGTILPRLQTLSGIKCSWLSIYDNFVH